MLQVVIVYNKSNHFGLQNDAELLAEALPFASRSVPGIHIGKVKCVDAREPPTPCDICIHLEVPYAVWFPWAKMNVMMVNHEWWQVDKWREYWSSFDIALFRDEEAKQKVCSNGWEPTQSLVVPWCVGPVKQTKPRSSKDECPPHAKGFVWFVGGSPNKRAAVEAVVPLWKSSYPPLTIHSAESFPKFESECPSNVRFVTGFLKSEDKQIMANEYPGHICLSQAESFGYTAAEAESCTAFTLLNTLPCYKELYSATPGCAWIQTESFSNPSQLEVELDQAIQAFFDTDLHATRLKRSASSIARKQGFCKAMESFLQTSIQAMRSRESIPQHMPPLLHPQDCPPISIITLVHNRPKFVDNACLNLLHTDYPRDKIEWVVVDDSDPDQSASHTIIQFEQKLAPGTIKYIPLPRKRSIGFKRNLGVEKASHDIILMMDDDDHYPLTSFRRRVAYLLKGRRPYDCAVCTTIAMYDLQKGVSAVNVPPFSLSLGERCSEATLTFRKSFWKERPFSDTNMAEGESFLEGRIKQVVEMPPQQIIVALTHGKNVGSRQVPGTNPGCFWGFPRPLLEFLHGLIGIKIEAA